MKRIMLLILALLLIVFASCVPAAQQESGSSNTDQQEQQVSGETDKQEQDIDAETEQDRQEQGVDTEQQQSAAETEQQQQSADIAEPAVPIIETEYSYDEDGVYYQLTLTARDNGGEVVWSYTSEKSMCSQYETLEYLGINGSLVYLNEQGIGDLNAMTHRVRALDVFGGYVVWDNSDLYGGAASLTFGDDGTLYIGTFEGTNCMAIGKDGTTLWKINTVDENLFWMSDISIEDGMLALTFDNCYDEIEPEPKTVYVTLDGKVVK